MPAEIIEENSLESKTQLPGWILNANRSAMFYHRLNSLYSPEEADQIALVTFAEDLRSLAWEATKMPLPNRFFYKVVKDGWETKLVHQSDLHWQKDIMDGVSSHYRDGLEVTATANFKKELLELSPGDSRMLISCKRDPSERPGRCPYVDTQVNIATRASEDLILVEQYQNSKLDRDRSIELMNWFAGEPVLSSNTFIDQLITTVARRVGIVSSQAVLEKISLLTGEALDYMVLKRYSDLGDIVKSNSLKQGQSLLGVIKDGLEGEALQQEFMRFLVETLGEEYVYSHQEEGRMVINTSCGTLSLFGDNRGIGWFSSMVAETKGAIRCNECGFENTCNKSICAFCKGDLKQNRVSVV